MTEQPDVPIAWACPVHGSTHHDEDGAAHWGVELQDGVWRCLTVGCDRTSADDRREDES